MTSDDQIIKGCIKQNRVYQRMLLDRYANYLMTIGHRYLYDRQQAEDALQETWIKVFNNIDQYKQGTNLKGWLSKIMINTSLRIIQRARTTEDLECNEAVSCLSKITSVEDEMSYEELMMEVNKLRSPAREVFIMYVIDGYPHNEIAEMMNIKSSTSRVHLTNARKALQIALIQTKSRA